MFSNQHYCYACTIQQLKLLESIFLSARAHTHTYTHTLITPPTYPHTYHTHMHTQYTQTQTKNASLGRCRHCTLVGYRRQKRLDNRTQGGGIKQTHVNMETQCTAIVYIVQCTHLNEWHQSFQASGHAYSQSQGLGWKAQT